MQPSDQRAEAERVPGIFPEFRPTNTTNTDKSLQTALDATSQRSTTTATDFPNITTHLIFLSEYSIDLLEVVIVWNALKTCRKVLGAELPMREEAQQFEARSEEVLKQAIASLDNISKDKAGKPMKSTFVTYIKDALERCR